MGAHPDYLMAIAPLTQQRVERLSDLGPLTLFFFSGLRNPTAESLVVGKLDAEGVRRVLDALIVRFDLVLAWNRDAIDGVVREVAAALGLKLKDMLKPVYVAITGSPSGVPLFAAMAILGRTSAGRDCARRWRCWGRRRWAPRWSRRARRGSGRQAGRSHRRERKDA